MTEEAVPIKISERIVLKKFEGDPPNEGKTPLQAIVIVDAKIIQVWNQGDSEPCPED